MKNLKLVVSVDEIPEPGLVIQGELPTSWLEPLLLPAYRALSPLKVDLELKCIRGNIALDGSLETTLEFSCSRTMEEGVYRLKVKIHELFQPKDQAHLNLGEGVDSELVGDELFLYEGRRIDLEPALREEIVLAQPPYPNISEDEQSTDTPIWTSDAEKTDPRWEKLRGLKLN